MSLSGVFHRPLYMISYKSSYNFMTWTHFNHTNMFRTIVAAFHSNSFNNVSVLLCVAFSIDIFNFSLLFQVLWSCTDKQGSHIYPMKVLSFT